MQSQTNLYSLLLNRTKNLTYDENGLSTTSFMVQIFTELFLLDKFFGSKIKKN